MSSARSWIITHKIAAASIAMATLLVVFAGALGVAKATDSPTFCRSACHEMQPFAEAWDQGPHAGIACVECHVDTGAARLTHKVEALGEVVSHVKGGVAFPLLEHTPIPSERCIRCHEDVKVTSTGFSHDKHAEGRACEDCHRSAGHEVSPAALQAADVYNPNAQRRVVAERVATVDGGTANVPGHVAEPCSRCHDLAKTGCNSCHEPKHDGTGPAKKTAACDTCHAAGPEFAFAHPAPEGAQCGECHTPPTTQKHTAFSGECQTCHTKGGASWKFTHTEKAACDNCHARPAKHREGTCTTCHRAGSSWAFSHPSAADCTTCHARPAKHRSGSCTQCHRAGSSWAFSHPSTRATCTNCHPRPAGHRSGSCTSCHRTGVSWAFSHPAARASCTNCHARPAGHRSGSCTTCHRVARSWAFAHPSRGACATCHARPANHRSGSCTTCHRAGSWRFSHPGSSATCTSCHSRPAGHRSGSCLTCHRVGSSWAFRHPTSSACSSCHSAPANHYGSSCASCHSPSRSWSSATFSHPRIPGGEHTYRSFVCSNCHPSGYGSHSCAKCHDSASGPSEDDD